MSINHSNLIYTLPFAGVLDGYRFAKMREIEGKENRHQFSSPGPLKTLDFGSTSFRSARCRGSILSAAGQSRVLLSLRSYSGRTS